MNRFPPWKYILIGLIVLLAALYTVPNFYGESPAVQVSSAKATVQVDSALMSQVEALRAFLTKAAPADRKLLPSGPEIPVANGRVAGGDPPGAR